MKNLSDSEADKIRRNPPDNMNLAQAAAYLGVAATTLWDAKNKKKVRCAKLGRRLIFQKAELDRWLATLSDPTAAK